MVRSEGKKGPSQRQLRVGEEIRHALADVLIRGELHDPTIDGLSITVSEVRISPDLKNATVYVTPLAGSGKADVVINKLNDKAALMRQMVNKRIVLRYSPKLYFKLDRSFDEALRVNLLLNSPEVLRDIRPREADEAPAAPEADEDSAS